MGEVTVERREDVDWMAFRAEAFSCGVEAVLYSPREVWMESESAVRISIEGSKGGGPLLGGGCEGDILGLGLVK